MFELKSLSEIIELKSSLLTKKEVSLFLKREDQIDPFISGNKWRKLKYNFLEAEKNGFNRVLTFGGAYSNHIAATAAAAKKYNFKCVGIIRGDELNHNSNATLSLAHSNGMNLKFISRSEYKKREESAWVNSLAKDQQAYLIPEGGSNRLALKGVTEMIEEVDFDFDCAVCAVGTGGTLAGITLGISKSQYALGFASLKGVDYLESNVKSLVCEFDSRTNWKINHDFHFGGYGKYDNSLIEFINEFKKAHSIQLDPIYTGKMMFGLLSMISKNEFKPGTKILAIHTGGLQGIEGFNQKNGLLIKE
ncbi:MAG: 1-aminocyclopropane-1-carboxylate deaminase/D-cysteine desulfhydrase [Reichenbachiella sp.]